MRFFEHGGLALANSIASWLNFVLLYYFLRKRFGSPGTLVIGLSLLKTFLASLIKAFLVRFLYGIFMEETGKIFSLIIAIGGGIGFYITITYLIKSDEFHFLKGLLIKRRKGNED